MFISDSGGKMAIKYFCFYHDYIKKFNLLDDEQAGRVVKAALAYAATGEETELPITEQVMFEFIKGDIDRQSGEYDRKCERNRKNVMKRYRKSEAEAEGEEESESAAGHSQSTTVYDRRQEEDKEEYKYEYEHYEEEKEEEEGKDKKEEEEKTHPCSIPTLLDVLTYASESGIETNVDHFLEYYDLMDWKHKDGRPVKDWRLALRAWAIRQDKYDSE